MSEIILCEEKEECLDRSHLLLEQKAVWREAQHTNLLLEPCGNPQAASVGRHQPLFTSQAAVRLVSQRWKLSFVFLETSLKNWGDRIIFVEVTM